MAPFGLTPAQYNVLRILRGSRGETMTCSEIGHRLLDRTPDVTRLLDRLERAGMVGRCRSTNDRRVVEVAITDDGLAVLEKMQPVVDGLLQQLTRHLSDEENRQISALMERLRTDQSA
jgi:DNA-binding MarR family transcriptional regulator